MTHLISASQPLHRNRLALHTAVLADTTIYTGVEREGGGVDMWQHLIDATAADINVS